MSAGVQVSEEVSGVKKEEVYEAAKKMMGREFQHVLASLLQILPDYEEMLVKHIRFYSPVSFKCLIILQILATHYCTRNLL